MSEANETRIPKGTKVQRFLEWRLDGRGRINGISPLRAGLEPDAFVELHHARNRLVAIREWPDGESRPIERIITLDAQGRLLKSERQGPRPGFKTVNRYKYDANGFLQERVETDAESGAVRFRTRSRVSPQGHVVEERQYDGAGQLNVREVYAVDAKGRRTKESRYDGPEGKALAGFFTNEYDPKGRLIRRVWHNPKGEPQTITIIELGSDHDLPLSVTLRPAEGAAITTKLTYDPKGKRVGREMVDAKGKKLSEQHPSPTGGSWHRSYRRIPAAIGDGNAGALAAAPPDEMTRDAWVAMAYKHFEAGRYAEALPLFRRAEDASPEDLYVLNAIGACALKLHRWEMALGYYERVLAQEPQHPQTLKGIACAREALGIE